MIGWLIVGLLAAILLALIYIALQLAEIRRLTHGILMALASEDGARLTFVNEHLREIRNELEAGDGRKPKRS